MPLEWRHTDQRVLLVMPISLAVCITHTSTVYKRCFLYNQTFCEAVCKMTSLITIDTWTRKMSLNTVRCWSKLSKAVIITTNNVVIQPQQCQTHYKHRMCIIHNHDRNTVNDNNTAISCVHIYTKLNCNLNKTWTS